VTARRAIVFACAGAVPAACAALWLLGSLLTAPVRRAARPPPAALGATAIAFASESGATIHAWLAPGTPGCGAVVLAHAVRSDRSQMTRRATFLHDAGYGVLLFDAQAHGESTGERITFGYRESHDARAAIAEARSRLRGERVAYLGVSQGGAAALLGRDPLNVDALILEAVYPTLREAIRNRLAIRIGPLAAIATPLLVAQIPLRLGVDVESNTPIAGISRVSAPLLVIAGADDRHTLLAESRRLFDAAPGEKEIWVLPGARHVDFHAREPAEYERRVLAFLARILWHAHAGGPGVKSPARNAEKPRTPSGDTP
jgi:fermentation-respiration switch protein FrsA (DUF1100 family)